MHYPLPVPPAIKASAAASIGGLILVVCLAFLLVSQGLSRPVFAQVSQSGNLQTKLDENKERKKQLDAQIAQVEEKLSTINMKEQNALLLMKRFVSQIDRIENTIIDASSRIRLLREEIAIEQQESKRLEGLIETERKKIYQTLLVLHKIQKRWDNLTPVYRAVGNRGLKESEALKIYARRTGVGALKLNELLSDKKKVLAALAAKRRELEQSVEQENINLKNLVFEKSQYNLFLEKITGEKSSELKKLGILKSNKQELDGILAKLLKSYLRNKSAMLQKLQGFPAGVAKPLKTPIAGRILHSFGDSEENISGSHYNGVVIQPPETRMTVTASFKGVVTFITTIRGFGNVVIIDHGASDYTVYGMLEEIFIDQGMGVQTGDIIGKTGAQPSNSNFYFEVRKKNTPINPISLLQESIWKKSN